MFLNGYPLKEAHIPNYHAYMIRASDYIIGDPVVANVMVVCHFLPSTHPITIIEKASPQPTTLTKDGGPLTEQACGPYCQNRSSLC